jgi:crotonobetainyl-CoA:carnitine CoA-transferase CaiB-like acyl-CoA transferase
LADFGAEVIKVEYFRRLDIMRGARVEGKAHDRHFAFRQFNRNKRSLALDLRDKRDLSVSRISCGQQMRSSRRHDQARSTGSAFPASACANSTRR